MAEKKKATGIKVAAASMAILVAGSGAALAKTIPGHPYGETLYGTNSADTIYGYGGADLVRAYGGADLVYGGNERGWGDALHGGTHDDRLLGQRGDDALYGDAGDDRLYGGYGRDVVVGDNGSDTLDGGPGADDVYAQDGLKDTIVFRSGEGDTIYFDEGLDEFLTFSTSGAKATMSAEEAVKAGKVKLVAEETPAGLFEPTGKILVEHEGERLLVTEEALEGHMAHGDHILDPTGRTAGAERGR